ncbi:DUF3253 domain-containing protein [Pseudoroseomonas globiformis]|uniref:DUF3253 domain-containing protein n=1 Tax=Teichococcus globiformis TaxID=2307229 RepID=A0ABV7G3B3_9PROT
MSVPTSAPTRQQILDEIVSQTRAAGHEKSVCPSEVARALVQDGEWRLLLGEVRRAALVLQAAGDLEILRKGKPVPAAEVRGVIRLRRPRPS